MIINIPNNNIKERKYIIDVLIGEFLGLDYQIKVKNIENYEILLSNNNKIIIIDSFFYKYKTELSYLKKENIPANVEFVENKFTTEKNIPVIYGNNELKVSEKEITCGIDIFASSFFMLTRWEEYVIEEKDVDFKFPDELSLAQKHNFHYRPVVNEYLEMLWNMLLKLDDKLKRKKQKYKAIITHDVDFIARYDTLKKYIRAIGGDIILRKNPFLCFKTTFDFIACKLKFKKDPYDIFDFLMKISEENGLKSRFYFIPGELGEEDVRYDMSDNKVTEIINNIVSKGHIVGIHGTYDGYNKQNVFKQELSRLQKTYPNIIEGRQHFLRFENPTTWQIWNDNNLKTDSTIGYSNDGGFRAGVCYEYPVFNILSRKKIDLLESPLIAMEVAVENSYTEPENFYEKIIELSDIVKKYKGNFVLLWHNSNFNIYEWEKYAKYYMQILNKISKKNK